MAGGIGAGSGPSRKSRGVLGARGIPGGSAGPRRPPDNPPRLPWAWPGAPGGKKKCRAPGRRPGRGWRASGMDLRGSQWTIQAPARPKRSLQPPRRWRCGGGTTTCTAGARARRWRRCCALRVQHSWSRWTSRQDSWLFGQRHGMNPSTSRLDSRCWYVQTDAGVQPVLQPSPARGGGLGAMDLGGEGAGGGHAGEDHTPHPVAPTPFMRSLQPPRSSLALRRGYNLYSRCESPTMA